MVEKDYTLKKQVLDLIKQGNTLPFDLTSDNVMLSEARQVAGEDYLEVRIRGVQDRGYRKTPSVVYYEPLTLDKIYPPSITPTVRTLSQSTLHALLPRVNAILGTHFTEDDVLDVDIEPFGNQTEISITVTAKPTSKFYKGTFTFVFKRHWLLLEEVIKPLVPAFTHPDPVIEEMTSVGLLTWGHDFTGLKELLKVDPEAAQYRGAISDIEGLREQLSNNFGIWNWPDIRESNDPEATIVDYDTRDVERANKNFKRVVVQTNVREKEYVGTAYFHYN